MEHHQEFNYLIAGVNSDPSMPGTGVFTDAEPNSLPYQHYKAINRELELVRKQARKTRKPGIS